MIVYLITMAIVWQMICFVKLLSLYFLRKNFMKIGSCGVRVII